MKKIIRKRKSLWAIALTAVLLLYPFYEMDGQVISHSYPQETLIARINKIIKNTHRDITFDSGLLGNVLVPTLKIQENSLEQVLAKTLSSTEFTYKKMPDNSFVIVKGKNTEKDVAGTPFASGRGTLKGTVLDSKGVPIVGATVRVPGSDKGTITDLDGKFRLQLQSGVVSVEVSYLSYQTMQIKDIKIAPNKVTPLDVVLKENSHELTEVVVTATYNQASASGLYIRQKNMVSMSDGISSELIKKTSDNNVAQVLKRVSGVTITDGKYVVVRGMSERYNNVQLNGTSLPSTEPNRRNFSFDIIPSNLIDNVTISKTFTPDMQGEFTGGMVEIGTLAIPKEKFINLGIGSGFNTNSTGKEFLSNKRFKSDYFLGNSSERNWFNRDWVNDTYDTYFNQAVLIPESAEKAYAMNAKIPNHWGLEAYKARPTQNYTFSIGKPVGLGNNNLLGVVIAATYRHEETTETIEEANYRNPDTKTTDGHTYEFLTSIGAVANIGWERPGHKITLYNLFNNRFTHNNFERLIDSNQDSGLFLEQYSSPMRNVLWQTRLEGEHKLLDGKLILTWFGDYNKLKREQHDDRLMKGAVNSITLTNEETGWFYREPVLFDGKYYMGWSSGIHSAAAAIGDGHIMYSDLQETKKNVGANIELPFQVKGNLQKIKAGYWGTFRKGNYEQQFIRPQGGADYGAGKLDGLPLHEYLSPEVMAKGYVYYYFGGVKGNKLDFYDGNQEVHAAYLMGDFSFFRKLHLTGGVRMEKSSTDVNAKFKMWDSEGYSYYPDSVVVRKKTDWLPAVTAIYNITGNINLRAAYGKTLARPDFRELTPYHYYNANDRVDVSGLSALKTTYTNNYDLRLEWYPEAGEVISLSAFYKKFKDPVELLTLDNGGAGNYTSFGYNLDKATVKGLELNLRKSFGFLAPGSILKDLYLTANATFLKGDVKFNVTKLIQIARGMDPEAVSGVDRKRPLQGLAPYVLNAGLAYQGKTLGMAVNYGTNGRKVIMAAPLEYMDEYEAPRSVLDFQISARFLKQKLEVKANASDLLNQATIIYCNSNGHGEDYTDDMGYNKGKDLIRSKVKKGAGYSFSVSYSF